MDAKCYQKGSKKETKTLPKSTFYEKVPKVIRTCYLLYIINIYRPENAHFSIPRATKNACGARDATFSFYRQHCGPHCGQQMAGVGSPGCPNVPQGLQNTSQNPPKKDTWQDRVPLRVPRVPAPPKSSSKFIKIYKNIIKYGE